MFLISLINLFGYFILIGWYDSIDSGEVNHTKKILCYELDREGVSKNRTRDFQVQKSCSTYLSTLFWTKYSHFATTNDR